ncbi:hypothetical protein B0A50_00009 [Salinomyces thailandicus]|uniref:Uncharacterized protein n=1 Tax=Salinomyces thailandicus TaxID=706561 RepID=A0A4V5N608_9PEZI|nr:hypothetical protein B0A50_00009 [Salinomyces thailandica]
MASQEEPPTLAHLSLQTSRGRLFPILDRFLEVNIAFRGQDEIRFAIVDDLGKTYVDEAMVHECGPTMALFQGKQPYECYELLCQLRFETTSDINPTEFVILDERSVKGDTAIVAILLLPYKEKGERFNFVRVAFEIAHWLLCRYVHDLYDERLNRIADEAEDGVLRAAALPPGV